MGLLDVPGTPPRTTSLLTGRVRPAAPLLVPASVLSSPPTLTVTKGTGASAAAVSTGGSGYAVNDTVTLAGGTAVVATVLKVTAVSTGVITVVSVLVPGVYTTAPTNAVAQASSSGSGAGATFTMTYATSSASSVTSGLGSGATSGNYRFTGVGPGNIAASGYYGNSVGNGTACLWEWNTDAAQFDIRLLGNNIKFMLFQDGVRTADLMSSTDASGSPYVCTITNSTGVPRTFKLFAINCAFNGIIAPTTASVWSPTHARRPLAWILGDSYTYGNVGTGTTVEARAADTSMCDLLGLEAVPDGVGGSGWLTAATGDPVTRVQTKLGALTRTVDYVFLDLGYNDAGGNMTTLATVFDNTVAAIRATTQAASARIIAFGPHTPLGTTGNLDLVKAAVSARATANGIPFVDVSTFVTSANKSLYTGADNVHPLGQVGHDYLAGRYAQAVTSLL